MFYAFLCTLRACVVVKDDAKVEADVWTVDERVTALEVRAGEQTVMTEGLREAVASLDRRIASLETRMDARFLAMDNRFTALDTKISRQFLWILGVQMTMFVAMIATLMSTFLMQR
jgi:hypothetical protein